MNVYDGAHNLASAIKQSDEFKEFKQYEEQLKANPELEKMINDFQQKSMEIQMKQMSGEELGADAMQSIQQLYGIVMQDPLAANYMQASMRFSLMMKDVFDIIGEATGTAGLM